MCTNNVKQCIHTSQCYLQHISNDLLFLIAFCMSGSDHTGNSVIPVVGCTFKAKQMYR